MALRGNDNFPSGRETRNFDSGCGGGRVFGPGLQQQIVLAFADVLVGESSDQESGGKLDGEFPQDFWLVFPG